MALAVGAFFLLVSLSYDWSISGGGEGVNSFIYKFINNFINYIKTSYQGTFSLVVYLLQLVYSQRFGHLRT